MSFPIASRWRAALAAVVVFATVAVACSDTTTPRTEGGIPDDLVAGIYPRINVPVETPSATQVDLYLHRVQVSEDVASYQGVLTYDTEVLTLDHTDLPAGMIGETNEVTPGRVRFAGASLDGVGDAPILTLRFTRKGTIRRETFGVTFEEVAGAGTYASLLSKVSTGTPYFTTGRGR
jgi:hypothetical protein